MRILSLIPTLAWVQEHFPTVKTVLFDMDGTLFDTEALHAMALKKVLGKYCADLSVESWEKNFLGKPDSTTFDFIKSNYHVDISYDEYQKQKNQQCARLLGLCQQKGISLYAPELEILIQGLLKNNFQVALVTASEAEVMHASLKLFSQDYFKLKISRQDTALSKPAPDPYLKAMKMLGVKPEEVLIFEDSPTGIAAGVASGANVVGVNWYEKSYSFKAKVLSLDD